MERLKYDPALPVCALKCIADKTNEVVDYVNSADNHIEALKDICDAQLKSIEDRVAEKISEVEYETGIQLNEIEAKAANAMELIPDANEIVHTNLKKVENEKAPGIFVEESGSIVSIDDAAAMPVHGLVSQIVPVQAGSGRNAVTMNRTGKNLIDVNHKVTSGSIQFDAVNSVLTLNGTDTSGSPGNVKLMENIKLKPGKYSISTRIIGGSVDNWYTGATMFRLFKGNSNSAFSSTKHNISDTDYFTISEDTTVRINFLRPGYAATFNNLQFAIQLEMGDTATEFEPPNIQTLTAALPETVYGGTLDWKSGVLISTLDANGTELAEPKTFQLTPQQLETLKGLNKVWSDCGDTSLVYVADTKMYIDKKFDALAVALIGG